MNKQKGNGNVVFPQMKLDELEKNRGYSTTMKAAWTAFFNNFKTIFKHLWPYAVGMSLVAAMYVLLALRATTADTSVTDVIGMVASYILLLLVAIVMAGRTYMLVNEKPFVWNIFRAAKLVVAELVVVLILSVVIVGVIFLSVPATGSVPDVPQDAMQAEQMRMAMVKTFAMVSLVVVVLLLLLLPYTYAVAKYVVDTKSKLMQLVWKGYKTGLRHWGYIFLTLLLTTICLFFVMLIIGLPLSVLDMAVRVNDIGVMNGDPSGMPGSIGVLTFFTAAVTFFCYSFLSVFSLFVMYYIYGSIERRVKEREAALGADNAQAYGSMLSMNEKA